MKKIAVTTLLGGAILGSLLGAGTANASTSGYLAAVEDVAYDVPVSTQLTVGNGTCDMFTQYRASGLPPAAGLASVSTMFLTSGFTTDASATVIYASVTELCPSNYSYMMAGAEDVAGSSGGSLYT